LALTAQQISIIAQWAERESCVSEVRLFGSHAKGTSHPGSDIDLAVTLTSHDRGNTALGIFFALHDAWQRQVP
jgi:predicted nucleotidyltransferase